MNLTGKVSAFLPQFILGQTDCPFQVLANDSALGVLVVARGGRDEKRLCLVRMQDEAVTLLAASRSLLEGQVVIQSDRGGQLDA